MVDVRFPWPACDERAARAVCVAEWTNDPGHVLGALEDAYALDWVAVRVAAEGDAADMALVLYKSAEERAG